MMSFLHELWLSLTDVKEYAKHGQSSWGRTIKFVTLGLLLLSILRYTHINFFILPQLKKDWQTIFQEYHNKIDPHLNLVYDGQEIKFSGQTYMIGVSETLEKYLQLKELGITHLAYLSDQEIEKNVDTLVYIFPKQSFISSLRGQWNEMSTNDLLGEEEFSSNAEDFQNLTAELNSVIEQVLAWTPLWTIFFTPILVLFSTIVGNIVNFFFMYLIYKFTYYFIEFSKYTKIALRVLIISSLIAHLNLFLTNYSFTTINSLSFFVIMGYILLGSNIGQDLRKR